MWKPFESTIAGSQTHTSKVLMTHYAEGYPILREGERQMPTPQQHHMATMRAAYPNELSLTIRLVGA